MKTNAERAQERLTLTPKTEFTLKKDGFIGALYQPEQDEYPGKAVIMFGGSDGIYNLTKLVAEQYVKRGMTILALAYWNEPGLPDGFEKVPVDSVEKAVLWLRGQGFENVGLWGISMGAELALLAGSLMPQLISCVTAVCPTNICGQGFVKKKSIQALECSAFSWRGEELPWARLKLSRAAILRDSLRERIVCLRSCYEDAVRGAPEEAQIKVENIGGPVLLLYPEHDVMWPFGAVGGEDQGTVEGERLCLSGTVRQLQIRQSYAGPGEVELHQNVPGGAEIPGAVLGERFGCL